MKLFQFLFLAVVVLLSSTQTGCNLAPKNVGEEKSSMLKGTQTVFNSDPVTVTAAAKEVADELKLNIEKNVSSGLDGKLIAKSANRMKLVVTSKAYGANGVLVTVRAGGFGDQGVQKQVLERIKAKLPETAYTPTQQPAQNVAQAPAQRPAQKMQAAPSSPNQAQTDAAQLPF